MNHFEIADRARREDSWVATDASDPNTPLTITVQDQFKLRRIFVTAIDVAIMGGTAGDDIAVRLEVDGVVRWQGVIGDQSPSGARCTYIPPDPIPGDRGAKVTLEVGAGGEGVVTLANLQGYSRP